MKITLSEDITDFSLISESYKQLWNQFEEVDNLLTKDNLFDLHHIYQKGTSKFGNKINYLILPREIHSKFPRVQQDAIEVYDILKKKYPDKFKQITVSFELFIPEDESEVTQLVNKEIHDRRNKRRRERYKSHKSIK